MLVAPPQSAAVTSFRHRYAPAESLDRACAQPLVAWLSLREQGELATWRNAERRCAWLRSRMLAKQLISAAANSELPFAEIEILSRAGFGRPRVWCRGLEQTWSLSLSHTDRGVLVGMTREPQTSVGVDLTLCQLFRDSFMRLWFTPAEADWLHRVKSPALPAFIWAAKEAIYKACNRGESFDPGRIEVLPQGECRYHQRPLKNIRLRSWMVDRQIAVLVADDHELSTGEPPLSGYSGNGTRLTFRRARTWEPGSKTPSTQKGGVVT